MANKKYISVGDEITYRGSWGMDAPKKAIVEGIEKSKEKRGKYGSPIKKIAIVDVEYGVFDLSDGHWCYGEQIVLK